MQYNYVVDLYSIQSLVSPGGLSDPYTHKHMFAA